MTGPAAPGGGKSHGLKRESCGSGLIRGQVPDEPLAADERKDKAGACKKTGDIDRFDAEGFVREENGYGTGHRYEKAGDEDRNFDADAIDPFADMNRDQRGDRRIN